MRHVSSRPEVWRPPQRSQRDREEEKISEEVLQRNFRQLRFFKTPNESKVSLKNIIYKVMSNAMLQKNERVQENRAKRMKEWMKKWRNESETEEIKEWTKERAKEYTRLRENNWMKEKGNKNMRE